MLLAELVEKAEELDRVGSGLLRRYDLDGNTLLEVDGNIDGLIGGVQGRDGLRPHVIGRGRVGVLEHASLIGAVREVVTFWMVSGKV